MTGLADKTEKVFYKFPSLSCIEPFTLVGGTALSLQIKHRLSEDLDFCRWVDSSSAANGIDRVVIEKELTSVSKKVETNVIDFDQVDFRVEGVKIQFFNEVGS